MSEGRGQRRIRVGDGGRWGRQAKGWATGSALEARL